MGTIQMFRTYAMKSGGSWWNYQFKKDRSSQTSLKGSSGTANQEGWNDKNVLEGMLRV